MKYCNQCVCLSFCLSTCVSQKPRVQFHKIFLYISAVTVAWPSLMTVQYVLYVGFVDDMFSHNGADGAGSNTLCFVEFAMWHHRGRSLYCLVVVFLM